MKTSDFDFVVPPELIAHEPAARRDQSRLMVLNRAKQTIEHKHFYDIIEYFIPGDLLVINDTKVMPANLVGRKSDGGGKVEVLLVSRRPRPASDHEVWECLVKPGKRLSVGSRIIFGDSEVTGTVLEKTESGEQIIEFSGDLDSYMHRAGEIPLPPYIKISTGQFPMSNEGNNSASNLKMRYQTVYADREGASAAPTAGLHFTPELLKNAQAKGIEIARVTLHTGLATFKPVYAENVEDHKMYFEEYEVPAETFAALTKAKRVVAVGTTSVRTLESVADLITPKAQRHESYKGSTNLFIYPGYRFNTAEVMVTNFHWPKTSLIMLVSAFAGREFIMRAYQEAIDQKYRFFSFGDAMLII
ncbi:tRNA preQ1(34) S-adenosylmethionine ribosyltransferase-isomerase QueA [candidate division WOR-1 bacterium RIFOXYB2_FULL_48_7]|uniref:S-adenosylmethionine:tRNA ribosyltransferase-isomerase n=1 Tax=candidate division WOR-1 bacterium RIFOXYB2_FULL_48_7 TaxID=1802583 RepID=A0A1F4TVU7_UNCSA|nr:MAG: tRNA preQ1(34) S-adenosylmethionine ribosyltransferase-isomerase QueA [candidate division WOR-1 bacterium RIFOXYB2_FULL_48_7]